MKQIYTAFIRISGLNLGNCNCAVLLWGCTPVRNSTITVTSDPYVNQSLLWPYRIHHTSDEWNTNYIFPFQATTVKIYVIL